MIRYELAEFRPSTLALSCLLMILSNKGYTNFIDQLNDFISEYAIPFDLEEVLRCQEIFTSLLLAETSDI